MPLALTLFDPTGARCGQVVFSPFGRFFKEGPTCRSVLFGLGFAVFFFSLWLFNCFLGPFLALVGRGGACRMFGMLDRSSADPSPASLSSFLILFQIVRFVRGQVRLSRASPGVKSPRQ